MFEYFPLTIICSFKYTMSMSYGMSYGPHLFIVESRKQFLNSGISCVINVTSYEDASNCGTFKKSYGK